MNIGQIYKNTYQFEKKYEVDKIAMNNAFELNSSNIPSLYTHLIHSALLSGKYDSTKIYLNKYLTLVLHDDACDCDDCVRAQVYANIRLALIKIKESKYEEAVKDFDILFNYYNNKQDTIASIKVLSYILEPLKALNKIDQLNIKIDNIELLINNYNKLGSQTKMRIFWSISKALQQIDINKSEHYKSLAIEEMDIVLKKYESFEDKQFIILNDKTVKELNSIIN